MNFIVLPSLRQAGNRVKRPYFQLVLLPTVLIPLTIYPFYENNIQLHFGDVLPV
jgi:hypothetical protein